MASGLSTPESLQGNGSKVPERTQEPGSHLLKADHTHQSLTLAVTSGCRRMGGRGLSV